MPTEEIAAFAVLGLVIGWLIGWALGRGGTRAEKQRADQLDANLKQSSEALAAAQSSLETARKERMDLMAAQSEVDKAQSALIAALRVQGAGAKENVDTAARMLDEQRVEITHLHDQLRDSETERASYKTALETEQKNYAERLKALDDRFKTLANEILSANSRTFAEQNQTNIGELLKPVKDRFEAFQAEVKKLNDSSIAGRTKLETQIENLAKLNTKLSDDANNLTTALKGSSKTQGNWGEQLLETILESAGLRKGYEYLTQESFLREERAADGHLRAQLDVLVRLPEDRSIIIDSKVSLNAYNDYCAAPDDTAREAALKEHIKSVRAHILGLSKRNYQLLDGINSADFVVMFMPIEPAFMLAVSRDGTLWQEAWNKNVLLVSPSTLLFVLRTVAQLWRQELQAKSVKEITDRGAELYDKLAAFAADLADVGKNLDKARGSYEDAVKKLSTGRGNVIRQAEMLKSLGVKPAKRIPIALVERSQGDEPLDLAAAGEPKLASMPQPESQADSPLQGED